MAFCDVLVLKPSDEGLSAGAYLISRPPLVGSLLREVLTPLQSTQSKGPQSVLLQNYPVVIPARQQFGPLEMRKTCFVHGAGYGTLTAWDLFEAVVQIHT
jgi:hypothetical protein